MMRCKLNITSNYVIFTLKGKIKGKSHEKDHIFPFTKLTLSGINLEIQIKLLIAVYKHSNQDGELAITNWDSKILGMGNMDTMLYKYLEELSFQGHLFLQ